MKGTKFRAWDKDKCKMIEWSNLHLETDKDGLFIWIGDDENNNFGTATGTNNFELMQYTGLNDMDGTEVCDGDILDARDRLVLVVWNQPNGCWDSIYIRYTVPISQLTSNGITPVEWKYRAKIIGNKYNNPELLKN